MILIPVKRLSKALTLIKGDVIDNSLQNSWPLQLYSNEFIFGVYLIQESTTNISVYLIDMVSNNLVGYYKLQGRGIYKKKNVVMSDVIVISYEEEACTDCLEFYYLCTYNWNRIDESLENLIDKDESYQSQSIYMEYIDNLLSLYNLINSCKNIINVNCITGSSLIDSLNQYINKCMEEIKSARENYPIHLVIPTSD